MEHMGITLRKRKYSFNLIREEFALINTKPSLTKFQSLIAKNAYTELRKMRIQMMVANTI